MASFFCGILSRDITAHCRRCAEKGWGLLGICRSRRPWWLKIKHKGKRESTRVMVSKPDEVTLKLKWDAAWTRRDFPRRRLHDVPSLPTSLAQTFRYLRTLFIRTHVMETQHGDAFSWRYDNKRPASASRQSVLWIRQSHGARHIINTVTDDSKHISCPQCRSMRPQKPNIHFGDFTRAKRSSLILPKVSKPATATDGIEQPSITIPARR